MGRFGGMEGYEDEVSGLEGSGEEGFRGDGLGLSGALGQVHWIKILGYIFRRQLFFEYSKLSWIYSLQRMDIYSIAHATVKMYIARKITRALGPFRPDEFVRI